MYNLCLVSSTLYHSLVQLGLGAGSQGTGSEEAWSYYTDILDLVDRLAKVGVSGCVSVRGVGGGGTHALVFWFDSLVKCNIFKSSQTLLVPYRCSHRRGL